MKNICIISTMLLTPLVSHAAEWSEWKFLQETKGVTIKYRTQPYQDKTRVEWIAKNNTGRTIDIRYVKTYTTSNGQTVVRKDSCLDLAAGRVYDPSADHISGTVAQVSVTLSVE